MGNDFFQYGPTPSAPPASAPSREPAPEGGRAILAELSDEDWEKFIGFATRRRYPAGALILEVGQAGGALGFVASGAVEVAAAAMPGAAVPRPELREDGDVFGMLGFLDGAPATVSVRARGSTEVLLLTREALLQLAAWQPRIAVALLRDLGATVAMRLRRVQGGD
ncbi:MAG: cyclic nucleotide-binding domain-containing protein [Burkholderiales bacterium]|nr:cyclic nucleotide-binding domain-containing protein [Burkholderiales bacterium]